MAAAPKPPGPRQPGGAKDPGDFAGTRGRGKPPKPSGRDVLGELADVYKGLDQEEADSKSESRATPKPGTPGGIKRPKPPYDPEPPRTGYMTTPSGRLTMSARIKSETFPGGRYPMPDAKHARLALQMINRGNLSSPQKQTMRSRANRMLGR